MIGHKKKKPGDYPLFAIRVDPVTKKELDHLVDETIKRLSKDMDDDQYLAKNEVVAKALRIGLPKVK